MFSRARTVLSQLVRPLAAALVTGTADPRPPRSRRLRFRVPRVLGLLPFRHVDLVVVGDLFLAYILFVSNLAIYNPRRPEMALIPLLASLPMVLRDRWPVAAWRLSAGITIVGAIAWGGWDGRLPYTLPQMIVYLLCTYSIAVRTGRDVALGVWGVSVLAAWIIHPDSMAWAAVVVAVAVLFGYNVRTRRTATSRLAEERQAAEEQRNARVILEERARIARELHDVVAHHMSVIAIQAEATPLQARGDPAKLESGLADIRHLSLAALAEMRQVLGALRGEHGRRETAPQPGLDRLDDLVATSRGAGLRVSVHVRGSLDLPTAVGLSAYRILQESLSNAMRHAPGSSVTIEIVRTEAELRLRVANGPGRGVPAASAGAGGQGIIGMRERAALLGGTVNASRDPDGGFVVRAAIPLTEDGR
ncbi:sensor histidine kinase [Sphaerisporangium fuscum]|uniref:sensor histidine kinase n=1 Tax=Sphaerisporangium fuscum TaxID=2835868 RepID=UPI001BDD6A7D|nr:histidine kinase [Sphaerisporangium fuscum]